MISPFSGDGPPFKDISGKGDAIDPDREGTDIQQSFPAQVKLRPLVLMQKGQVTMRSQGKKGMAEKLLEPGVKQPRRQIPLM